MTPAKVADASVIAAIAFKEPESERALSLTDGAELHAPRLLDYELASVARTKIRRYPEQRDNLVGSLVAALATRIQRHDVDHLAVVRMALATGLSTYDASYLQLARLLGVPLVTLDERLQAAAGPSI